MNLISGIKVRQLKFERLRLSNRSKILLGTLKSKTGLTPNILARFALGLSLKDPSIPNPDEFDEKGSELSPSTLFGKHESLYHALMIQRLHYDRLNPGLYLQKMTRAHLNRGVIALSPRINDLSDFYELVKNENS